MILDMRFRLDSAKVVTAALATILGLQVAWLVTGAFARHEPAPTGPEVALSTAPTLRQRAESIAARGLFGGEIVAPVVVRSSSSEFALAGVLAEDDPLKGQAILAERGGPARVYRAGAMLPGGLRLQAIHADHVVLERDGQLERLDLPRQTAPQTPAQTIGSSSVAPPQATALPSAAFDTMLGAAIRWQAVLRPGMPSGVRVYPGADARAFTRLGLQPGDLVIALNDAPLADQANGEEFLRSLSGMPQASLTVERSGQVQKILIDLAGLTPIGAN
jgi:general secretion pathway protein C